MAVCVDQLIAHAEDLVDGRGGCGVGLEERRLVNEVPSLRECRPHGQLAYVHIQAVERGELRRQAPHAGGRAPRRVYEAWYFDAAILRQVVDRAAVADIAVDHPVRPRLNGVDDLRGVFGTAFEFEWLARLIIAPWLRLCAAVPLTAIQVGAHRRPETAGLG